MELKISQCVLGVFQTRSDLDQAVNHLKSLGYNFSDIAVLSSQNQNTETDLPEYEIERFENVVRAGGILLSIHVKSVIEINEVKKILEMHHGGDVVSTAYEKPHRLNSDVHRSI